MALLSISNKRHSVINRCKSSNVEMDMNISEKPIREDREVVCVDVGELTKM